MTRLSEHFTLTEWTKSKTATAHGIENKPSLEQIAMFAACSNWHLETYRRLLGDKPIRINSGFRNRLLNSVTPGAAKHSAHMAERGRCAVDFERPGVSNMDVARVIESCPVPFDTLILEYANQQDPDAGWIHLAVRFWGGPNRRRVLSAVRRGGRNIWVRRLTYSEF